MKGADGLRERAAACAEELARAVARGAHVRIISHNDVDGVSSGTIMLTAVRRLGGTAHVSFKGHVYADELLDLLSQRPEFLVLCDMGSNHVSQLEKSGIPYLIADHHPFPVAKAGQDERLVNPFAFGVDGTREISGSGVAYLIARAMGHRNVDLARLALCGSFGDMQRVVGFNEAIASEAESRGLVREVDEIRLIGRRDRPAEYSITYTTNPFIKGLSGDPLSTRSFLEHVGVTDPQQRISDLEPDKAKMLLSELRQRMVAQGASTFEIDKLYGQTFELVDFPVSTLDDLVDYVDCSASLERYSLAVSVLWGKKDALDEAEGLRLGHKQRIFEGTSRFSSAKHGVNADFLFLEGLLDLSGTLCGIYANAGFAEDRRPVFGLSQNGDWVKISARVDPQMVTRGLHLGRALEKVCGRLGGSGGGHDVAAGGRIPTEAVEELVKALDEEVGLQLSGDEHV